MRVAIHQPNLLPWLGFFAKVAQVDTLIVLDDVPFSRGSYTNRVRYRRRDGTVDWLTLPVRHNTDADEWRRIDSVVIDRRGDVGAICDRLYDAYADAPHAAPILGDVFSNLTRAHDATSGRLAAVNFAGSMALGKWLGLGNRFAKVVAASQVRKAVVPGVDGLIRLVLGVGGTHYVAGTGADAYDDPSAWAAAGIQYRKATFRHPEYPAGRAATFTPGLTALDALVWSGPAAEGMIREAIK